MVQGAVNALTHESVDSASDFIPIYDINHAGVEEKFANSIIHVNQFSDQSIIHNTDSDIFRKWSGQSDFQFGFIPLGEQKMPKTLACNNLNNKSLIEVHHIVRKTGKPNFLGARIPVTLQLKVEVWQDLLKDYWDQQLLQLLRFGFPLDFNRNCPLENAIGNHASATQFPGDVYAYVEKESKYGALLGPFKENPIAHSHVSPFMTRNKPNSDRRRVIIDLSWSHGASVNSGIDKDTYLDSAFTLTFPTVDHITSELKRLGRGALLYKIDVSRAFCHVRINPGDYDLVGLHWHDAYIDTCLLFGMRHWSQIFQH